MAKYAPPGTEGSVVSFKPRYDHFIGGEYVAPAKGQYFENPTPVTGETFTEVARGTADDIEKALDAAHAAAPAWGKTSAAERANILNKMADRVEANLESIAIAEAWENGKAVPRDARRRHPARGRPLALLRRCPARPGGLALRDRREHHRVPLPRAARRRRADHPVELPDPHGDLEARPGAGRGQRDRAEAGRADSRRRSTCSTSWWPTCCRRVCSTSSTASASRPASRSRRTSASARSRSPARPPPAG